MSQPMTAPASPSRRSNSKDLYLIHGRRRVIASSLVIPSRTITRTGKLWKSFDVLLPVRFVVLRRSVRCRLISNSTSRLAKMEMSAYPH